MHRLLTQSFRRFAMMVALCLVAATLSAQESRAFKVGFLLGDSDSEMRGVMENLRESLLANEPLMHAMRQRGYSDIWLRPSDDPFDMIQRLDANEFHLAFATSVIYARQFKLSSEFAEAFEPVAYQPIFQFRRLKGDIVDPRGNGVFRRGVVFAGPGSGMIGLRATKPDLWSGAVSRLIQDGPIAVSDSYSAASYIYPRLRLADEFSTLTLRGTLFCKSESAVVKHVVSGLVNVGACDVQTLEDMSAAGYCEELFRTDPIPTDPILLLGHLTPEMNPLGLGRELKVALQNFFNAESPPIDGVKIEKASDRAFEDMARALQRFDEMQQAPQAGREPSP